MRNDENEENLLSILAVCICVCVLLAAAIGIVAAVAHINERVAESVVAIRAKMS